MEELISIAEAARAIGVNRSTLQRQIKAGMIREHGGKVRLSEVLEDRASNIDLGRANRGKAGERLERAGDAAVASAVDATSHATKPADIDADATADATDPDATEADATDPDATVLVDGQWLPYATARAMKETYLARLRQLQYETQLGLLAPIEETAQLVEAEYAIIREHLLGLPGKLGASVAGMTTEQATAILQTEIDEVLRNLSEPGEIAAEAAKAAVVKI